MDLSLVDVIAVRPARPANVAAACRAMKNMGLKHLTLVDPPPGLEEPEARALAYGAWDVLDAAVMAPNLRSAVAPCVLVVGTSGRPHPDAWTPRRLAEAAGALTGGGRMGIVFGPEATGLTNDELALCGVRVHIPTDPAHTSLNLAQAVLILAYELFLAAQKAAPAPPQEAQATAGEIETALLDLRAALLEIGYLNPDNPDALLAELRWLAARARPTPREVSLLRGMARQVRWAAGCAGLDKKSIIPPGEGER